MGWDAHPDVFYTRAFHKSVPFSLWERTSACSWEMWGLAYLALWEQWYNKCAQQWCFSGSWKSTSPWAVALKWRFFPLPCKCILRKWVCLGTGKHARNGLEEVAVPGMGQEGSYEALWRAGARGTFDFQKLLGLLLLWQLVGIEGQRVGCSSNWLFLAIFSKATQI